MNSNVKKEIPSGRNAPLQCHGLRSCPYTKPVRKFQYLNTTRNTMLCARPTQQNGDPLRYSRLKMASQMKTQRQIAPGTPPTDVREKNTKKAQPENEQIQGRQFGRANRKARAAGIRNNK